MLTPPSCEKLAQAARHLARLYRTRADIATLIGGITQLGRAQTVLRQSLTTLAATDKTLSERVRRGDITPTGYQLTHAALLDKQLKLLVWNKRRRNNLSPCHWLLELHWRHEVNIWFLGA